MPIKPGKNCEYAIWFFPKKLSLQPVSEQEINWSNKFSPKRAREFLHSRGYIRKCISELFCIDRKSVPIFAPPGRPPILKNGFGNISISHCKDAVLIGWSLFFGALIMTPITLNYLPEVMPSQLSILSMLWLGVVSRGIAYVAYVRLIKNIGAIKTSSVTYLIPVFGIIWGNIFLSEEITFLILIGFIFIMLGLYLINRKTI